jgi:hypothetical protein
VSRIGPIPLAVLVPAVAAGILVLTELTSNTATAATFLPVAGGAALGLGLDPLLLTAPVALAASCAFMLPVAIPPNAIAYGSGYVTVGQMIRGGCGSTSSLSPWSARPPSPWSVGCPGSQGDAAASSPGVGPSGHHGRVSVDQWLQLLAVLGTLLGVVLGAGLARRGSDRRAQLDRLHGQRVDSYTDVMAALGSLDEYLGSVEANRVVSRPDLDPLLHRVWFTLLQAGLLAERDLFVALTDVNAALEPIGRIASDLEVNPEEAVSSLATLRDDLVGVGHQVHSLMRRELTHS